MINYVEKIGKLLRQDKPVIFYTVSGGTFENIRALKDRCGLCPTAVCDGDVNKQGRTYRGLEELTVLSPKAASDQYPGAYWFIPSLDYRFQIIGYLTQTLGILPEYIINYTPVHKITTCRFLQKALIYDRNGDVRFCWRNPCPSLPSDCGIKGRSVADLRNGLIKGIRVHNATAASVCAECPQICEDFYPVEAKAWSVNYFCNSVCNYKCSYCTISNAPEVEPDSGRHTLGEVLAAFNEAGILDQNYNVTLSTAGEPLLHPKRKEFYQAFDGAELNVNTNASIFDPDLFELMAHKPVLLVCSVDAGTQETYQKIKGVDGFARIRRNLAQYAQAPVGIVALKYLFVPGVNDTSADIDGFIDLCMETGAMYVIISVDYFSVSQISAQTQDMIQRLRAGLSEKDILCVPYTAWETAEYEKMMRTLFEL